MADISDIKKTFDKLHASPDMLTEVLSMTTERKVVTFKKKKSIAAIAAIACLAIGTTVFAAGGIASYVSWSNPFEASKDYSSVTGYVENEDLHVTLPESLSNGYAFESSNIGGTKALDDQGNTVSEGDSFMVIYQKNDAAPIYLNIDPILGDEDFSNATDKKVINGVYVYYNQDTYKFVPEDYELTAEDQEKMKDPHYEISYGSSEVNEQTLKSISFMADNKIFTIISFDNEMSSDEWFEMAEDFLK
ncbi:MAG: hypothetical protein KBS83_07205 [Lachnospiraceae bacterium]|nr:hypothetical protein [Candidatus Equihabitans merdae]